MAGGKVRLYVDHPLGAGQTVPLDRDQAHYLFSVMRLAAGAQILLFNGRDGEFAAEVVEAGKRSGVLVCREQTRPLQLPPDVWLMFAPLKKARTDFVVEKATELGVARILPVQTEFTNAERVRQDRLCAHAVEAAEQCGATCVPLVESLEKLSLLLDRWPPNRRILFCDEAIAGAGTELRPDMTGPWAILIGPEGGFSPRERARIMQMDNVVRMPLGPRILRADTAAIAALTLWQSMLGDW